MSCTSILAVAQKATCFNRKAETLDVAVLSKRMWTATLFNMYCTSPSQQTLTLMTSCNILECCAMTWFEALKFSRASSLPTLPMRNSSHFRIPVPPLSEQQTIVVAS